MSRPQSHFFAQFDRDEPDPVLERPTRRICPVPRCTEPMPEGKHAIFCAEHHFQLSYETTNHLFRWQLKCERAPDDATRVYMREQLQRDIQRAVHEVTAPKQAVH